MGTSTTQPSQPIATWKRIAIRAVAGGVGLGLVLVVAAVVIIYFSNRPREWNEHALRVVHAEAVPSDRLNDKLEQVSSGVTFDVDIQNTTGSDITIAGTLDVLSETKTTHALRGTFLKLRRDYFLPARNTVSISLDNEDMCTANYDPRQCYDSYFKDADALVLFDQVNRYKVSIPIPPLNYEPSRHAAGGSKFGGIPVETKAPKRNRFGDLPAASGPELYDINGNPIPSQPKRP